VSRSPSQRQPGRRKPLPPTAVVALLVAALLFYFGLIGVRGFLLFEQPRLVLKALGCAVLVLPLVGAWVVVAELRFGAASQRLAGRISIGGESPEPPDLPRSASGRVDPAAADLWFQDRRAAVEAEPDRWQSWFRLAQAYDLAGDRRRARSALRTAIGKEQA
jgi:hypothetical protein